MMPFIRRSDSTRFVQERGARVAVLLDENERVLTAFAARLLRGDRERARDAVQEIFLRLCRRDDLDGVDRAWLFTATRRHLSLIHI